MSHYSCNMRKPSLADPWLHDDTALRTDAFKVIICEIRLLRQGALSECDGHSRFNIDRTPTLQRTAIADTAERNQPAVRLEPQVWRDS